jgi:hypothetical protein
MSEESTLEQLLALMQLQSDLIRKLLENQEKFEAEQAKAAKALGEAGMILIDHPTNLRNLGAATTRLWVEAGLPVNEQPSGPVN